MSAQPIQPQSVPGPAGQPFTLTLQPLVTDGQAALAPDAPSGIVKIALSQVVLLWHNAYNEVTIRRADDLFACAARDGTCYDPIPKGADLVQATLDFQFAEFSEPHFVDIVPPHSLTLQNPGDAPRILQLLANRGFHAAQKLALALLLTSACWAPDCWAGAADDDDDDDDLPSLSRRCLHSSAKATPHIFKFA